MSEVRLPSAQARVRNALTISTHSIRARRCQPSTSTGGISGQFRRVEDRYNHYDVVDLDGDKIGTVDHTYVSESDQREYVAVSRGLVGGLLPGTGSSIIPLDVCTVDNTSRTIQVNAEKEIVKNSPSLGASDELSPEYESQVRSYYRL